MFVNDKWNIEKRILNVKSLRAGKTHLLSTSEKSFHLLELIRFKKYKVENLWRESAARTVTDRSLHNSRHIIRFPFTGKEHRCSKYVKLAVFPK